MTTNNAALVAEANRESTREHPERIRLLLRGLADALEQAGAREVAAELRGRVMGLRWAQDRDRVWIAWEADRLEREAGKGGG